MTTEREYLEALSQGREFGEGFPVRPTEPTITLTPDEVDIVLGWASVVEDEGHIDGEDYTLIRRIAPFAASPDLCPGWSR